MPRIILFDVDGTLVDSVDLHARSWAAAFERFGVPRPLERLRAQIGKGSENILKALLSDDEIRRVGEALVKWREQDFIDHYLDDVRPFPQVPALFERLKSDGHRLALASSAKAAVLDRLRPRLGIDGFIEAVTSSADAKRSKPEPDIFEACLEKLGSPPKADVLVVGDSPYDALAAGKLGISTVGLLCGGFPADELREAGCIAIYRDPADLLASYEASPLSAAPAPR